MSNKKKEIMFNGYAGKNDFDTGKKKAGTLPGFVMWYDENAYFLSKKGFLAVALNGIP